MSALEILTSLAKDYEKKIAPEQMSTYVNRLTGVDTVQLQQAANHWIDTEKWFPKVSELKATIRKMADVAAQSAYDNPRKRFWRAMGVRNAVLREEMDTDALKVYPEYAEYAHLPNEHQAEELGEWWAR